jgi:GDP/UDP-N,N'-diacetylbacillosamine 2-epimerase (hydrolysing)
MPHSYKLKIGVLTSSRADYGIYQPLLKRLAHDEGVDLHLIAFGMHLLPKFGSTIDQVIRDDFGKIHRVDGMPELDDVITIASGYGKLIENFSHFWAVNKFNKVLALGDRFEMSAAVQASIPFEVPIAHLHGGETTLGAIDNIYRHQITLASQWHFVATEEAKGRVIELMGGVESVKNVGALSLDRIEELAMPEWSEVASEFNIPNESFLLITIHPETVSLDGNIKHVQVLESVLCSACEEFHLVITLANADAMGSLYRDMANRLKSAYPRAVSLVDNFGRKNYFAAMKASLMLLGNTSSGILEAASFRKFVINLGDRQKGRLQSANIFNVAFEEEAIITAIRKIKEQPLYQGSNVYYQPNTAIKIHKSLTCESL